VPASRPTWAWHQLSPAWADRLVVDAGITPGDWVVDIGAGLGALTRPLLAAGARVIAVEAHAGRASQLRRRFGASVVVVQADAADLRLPRRPYHVVANPPFSVTAPLVRRLLQPGSRLVSARLIVQEQAARRFASEHLTGSERWERTFDLTAGPRVPRGAFRPEPRVNARVLRIDRRASGVSRRR
jgi:23S rRNA (adenine-N6)-dimethyltransferase